jgi:hypothetical protein
MLLVVLLALVVGSSFASRPILDLTFIQNLGEMTGLAPRRRATPVPNGTMVAAPDLKPSPAPATPTPEQPPAPLGALPTAVAGQRFAGSQVTVSNQRPGRRSDLTVTLRLMREGQPVPNANVYLIAHYRTVDERQPPGNSTVRTDEQGNATITFNIGDATANFQVNLDVTALIDGQQVVFQSSFTPV